jgi:pyruvate dehydrogenase kinase 2/3/4
VIKDAYENARFLCDQYYLASPDLIINEAQHNGEYSAVVGDAIDAQLFTELQEEGHINIVYVPSHLYHMLFELFKNAMRAVMEYHCSTDKYPPITITIAKGKEDISLKVPLKNTWWALHINERTAD